MTSILIPDYFVKVSVKPSKQSHCSEARVEVWDFRWSEVLTRTPDPLYQSMSSLLSWKPQQLKTEDWSKCLFNSLQKDVHQSMVTQDKNSGLTVNYTFWIFYWKRRCYIDWLWWLSLFFNVWYFRCGDILLSVNQHSLVNVTHSLAVDLLKQADGAVTLTAVSWPGTIVWKSLTLSVHHGLGQLWNDLLSPLCQNKQLSGQQLLLKNLQTYSSRKSQSWLRMLQLPKSMCMLFVFLIKTAMKTF